MKNLKIIILLIAIFISTIAFSQQVGVTVLRDKCITTAQRNAIVVTSGEQWKICNSDTGKNEFWNGTSWEETVSASGLPTEFINGDGTLNTFITVTQAVDLDTMESDIGTNTTKLSGIESGATADQTSIVGITGTKAQFDTTLTDGDFVYVGDMATSGTYDFVASGAISTGQVVGLRSDGKVEIIDSNTIFDDFGTEEQFQTSADYISSVYDPDTNKIIIAYQNSNGEAVVGTVSGTTISFGTPVEFESGIASEISIIYDSLNDKVVITYRDHDDGFFGKSVVGTVSGTSISFGTITTFESANTSFLGSTFDSSNNKVVIGYRRDGFNGKSIVGTVSGTSISFGTSVEFESGSAQDISLTFDSSNNKVVISYRDNGDSSFGKSVVGTVSGTSISFGSITTFESANTSNISSTFDSSNNKVVILYTDVGNSSFGTAIVGTISGTSISFGTAVVFESASTAHIGSTFDSSNNKVIITYQDVGNSSFGTLIVGTVSGTSISFDTPVIFKSALTTRTSIVYDLLNDKSIISYSSTNGKSLVYSFEITTTNVLTTIGIATEAIIDTETGTITIISGVNDQQSGLTPGVLYYVQFDGVITATPNQSFDFKTLGRALTATIILIEKIE